MNDDDDTGKERDMKNRVGRRGVLGVLLTAALLSVRATSAGSQAIRIGQPAPEVTGESWINSTPLTTESLRGRVVLVDFWTYG
jgi:hypothetical protein